MRAFRTLLTVLLVLLTHSSNAQSPNLQCSTLSPYDGAAFSQRTVAAKQRAEILRSSSRAANGLKRFLDTVFSIGVREEIRQSLIPVVESARTHLVWTGHRAAVVEIVLQRDFSEQMPPELLRINFVGSGNCAYDAIVDAISKDNLLPQPKPGYRVDNDSSFFVVSQRKVGTNVSFGESVLVPGSRGPVYEKAYGDSATRQLLARTAATREYQQLVAIVEETLRLERSEVARQHIREALDARAAALSQQAQIEATLRQSLEESNKVSGASAWVERFKDVLAYASLVVQVRAMLSTTAPKSVFDGVDSATTPESLGAVLRSYEQAVLSERAARLGESTALVQKIEAWRVIIIENARKNGAPNSSLQLPSRH